MPDKAQPGRAIGSGVGSIVFREHAADDVFVDIDAKARAISCAMRGQPIRGLRRLNATIASMSSFDGPFGPGRRWPPDEKSSRYLRFLSASWNLNKVLGFRMTASLGIRPAGTNSDPRPKTTRSNEFKFGARRRARLLMTNWCFSNRDSATTARTPPGRRSLAMVVSRWTASVSR
jgi:hypothetical protein